MTAELHPTYLALSCLVQRHLSASRCQAARVQAGVSTCAALWHPPKACSGRSPDLTASSPMSALVGASRMPLLMRSAICGHAHSLLGDTVCHTLFEHLQPQMRALADVKVCALTRRLQEQPCRSCHLQMRTLVWRDVQQLCICAITGVPATAPWRR
jgi:hypothetical protein